METLKNVSTLDIINWHAVEILTSGMYCIQKYQNLPVAVLYCSSLKHATGPGHRLRTQAKNSCFFSRDRADCNFASPGSEGRWAGHSRYTFFRTCKELRDGYHKISVYISYRHSYIVIDYIDV